MGGLGWVRGGGEEGGGGGGSVGGGEGGRGARELIRGGHVRRHMLRHGTSAAGGREVLVGGVCSGGHLKLCAKLRVFGWIRGYIYTHMPFLIAGVWVD